MSEVDKNTQEVKVKNPFITELAPGHELMSYQNGRITREVVASIQGANLGEVPVISGRKIVYAVQGLHAPAGYNSELTGLLRSAGRETRVVVIPTKRGARSVSRTLAEYLGADLLGKAFAVIGHKDVLTNAQKLKERAELLVNAKVPLKSVDVDDD